MTALAMILGMLPMSLGLGEGGEQNAPLGRAVIGGLAVATFTTLFFVPVVYSAWRKKAPRPSRARRVEVMTEPRQAADTTAHEPPSQGEAEVFDPAEHRPTSRGLGVTGLVALLVVAVLVAAGVVPRVAASRRRPSASKRPQPPPCLRCSWSERIARRRASRSCSPARCSLSRRRPSTRARTATCESGTSTSAPR